MRVLVGGLALHAPPLVQRLDALVLRALGPMQHCQGASTPASTSACTAAQGHANDPARKGEGCDGGRGGTRHLQQAAGSAHLLHEAASQGSRGGLCACLRTHTV